MNTRRLHKGTIVGLFRESGGSGIALLGIEDDEKGKVLIPCDGNPACRAFDAAFPGTLIGGRFNNDGIAGERIYYTVNELGVLEAFVPVEDATPELVEEYEEEAKKNLAPRKSGHIGFVEPDDPQILKGSQPSKPGTHTRGGFLPPDHLIFSGGPIVSGRPILAPGKKPPNDFN